MLLSEIRTTIKKFNLIKRGDRIIAGVSGGPDSLALLYLSAELKDDLGFSLSVAHVDHSLRRGSAGDAIFVRDAAARLGLPFFGTRLPPGKLRAKGSVEEAARLARLDFLLKCARKTGANKIALGHNFEDQAETVLMRLLRGTGLMGLAGILPKRRIGGITVIRPLIEAKRVDIEKFLKHRRLKPRDDPTNKSDIYFRNKVRNKLLPLLEKEYNRNIREVLANMSESAVLDYDFLRLATASRVAPSDRISLIKARKMHPALFRMAVRNAIAAVRGDTRRITFRHIREVEDLLLARPAGSVVDLPGSLSVIKNGAALCFKKKGTVLSHGKRA